MRTENRKNEELRNIIFEPHFLAHAEGSCMITCGRTKVLCAASVEEKVPFFLRNSGNGWITAEYSLLPRSTHTRTDRESSRGRVSGRTHEIQRLISRSLRSIVDLEALGERQIHIDCDVIQADGGTRVASISGACVALYFALKKINKQKAFKQLVAGVSCGSVGGKLMVDLDYMEDSNADIDANFAILENGSFVEVQATGERNTFEEDLLFKMLSMATTSAREIFLLQRQALAL